MDEHLKLAEAYYAVANDLRCNAHVMNNMADQLFDAADRMCEKNIKRICTRSHPHENMNAECARQTEATRSQASAGNTNGT